MGKWYNEAVFYHMYPLGMTGAPKENKEPETVHRLRELFPWIDHLKEIGVTAIYIGPLFESSTHGYDTKDYKKVDRRLGDNEDFKEFVRLAHENGIRVVVDGVFNHTGREFFAFQDIQKNREHSPYCSWYKGVNFGWNSPYNDGFGYEAWRNCFELVNLNLYEQAVRDYLFDVIHFWITEFDIDGIRLDCADCLTFDFMKEMRYRTGQWKEDFWLMGEVIHGDYSRWVNGGTLHSVTNYALHKALYSGHNDHNYFEIAHTVKYLQNMGDLDLYNFVDNHDVERIYTKLSNKAHFAPVHVLLYTLPGIPSIYYGSEFGIEGKKEKFSDASLRPALNLEDYKNAVTENPCTALIAALGKIRQATPGLSYGSYNELMLTNRQYAFARDLNNVRVIVTVNNDDNAAGMNLPVGNTAAYIGALSGKRAEVQEGRINVTIPANSGEIWIPEEQMKGETPVPAAIPKSVKPDVVMTKEEVADIAAEDSKDPDLLKAETAEKSVESNAEAAINTTIASEDSETVKTDLTKEESKEAKAPVKPDWSKSPEEMTVAELQAAILTKMAGNGPITDQMKKTVDDNIWHDSLVNWLKSFR